MSLELIEAIRYEHKATVEAVHCAQARAPHLGSLLLDVRQELGKAGWEFWLQYRAPIPAGAYLRSTLR